MRERRVLYIQYTNPAAYPPLEHSAHILANAGWDVLFAGIESYGARELRLRAHERISVATVGGRSGGPGGLLKYVTFAARTARLAQRLRPTWIYASDALSAPAALLAAKLTGARIVYHEHDVPADARSTTHGMVMRARDRLIARADVLVVPAEGRRASLGHAGQRALVVWNCPMTDEVAPAVPHARDDFTMIYAGSISPDRVPVSFVRALSLLPENVRLRVIGYQTVGAPRYPEELRAVAHDTGVGQRVEVRGPVERRMILMENELGACDIGIATINTATEDVSLRTMVGASNKAFDYMARGLPFLVNTEAAWRDMFVSRGYAVACEPSDPASIAAAVAALLDQSRRREMGERARIRILSEWNYEKQFAPVLAAMSS
jgi:glycosyltransferase involved in cell wall biosynthesis